MKALSYLKKGAIFILILLLIFVIQINSIVMVSNSRNIISMFITFFVILFLLLFLKNKLGFELVDQSFKLKNMGLTVMLAVISVVQSVTFSYVASINTQSTSTSNDLIANRLTSSNLVVMIIAMITVNLTGPILEEIVFRGMLFQQINNIFNSVIYGYIITAIIFAYMHGGGSFMFVSYFLSSIITTYAFGKTGNIFNSIICHQLINIFSTLQLLLVMNL
ncbi:CPBP family intramembrane metalloprotease [Companilactobacillus allii]|uniref:CAAX prenyl protease 2/Lysostaphin resistance protein A-like domain-containing protein n=1 Tax=Companilactobacillus allii TaxID=1847728 RepID=A0A1P8Q1E9_9LACO|nr:type II CAAX endopeptidase family protein [Companilactobacillus allii]APX71656.1 hypothetical protein BTM29_03380 [Companilactobacillus allii]USQ68739.1 CPBP family intramembrane metalloprotease [Companilactobacillus allii]